MKRSEINKIIDYTIDKAEFFKIPLPPFAFYTLEDWKATWMNNVGKNNALFISAVNKENFEEFREKVYNAVREIHITRFPYNKFLYPDYNDVIED